MSDTAFIDQDFHTLVKFTVTAQGLVDNISFDTDTIRNNNTIAKKLFAMTSWSPATQNGLPVEQRFELPIFSTKEIFTIVEQQPEFDGGVIAFYNFIGKNMRYPSEARKMGIEGKVFVQFVVDIDGSIKDVKILRGIGGSCDEEALRIIMAAPDWKPGLIDGKPVRVEMVLPITFKLS